MREYTYEIISNARQTHPAFIQGEFKYPPLTLPTSRPRLIYDFLVTAPRLHFCKSCVDFIGQPLRTLYPKVSRAVSFVQCTAMIFPYSLLSLRDFSNTLEIEKKKLTKIHGSNDGDGISQQMST